MAVSIPEQQIPALLRGCLYDRAGQQIETVHGLGLEPDADASPGSVTQSAGAAAPGVALTADVGPGTVAGVDAMRAPQLVERVAIDLGRVALSRDRSSALVGLESEPVEIVEDGVFVCAPAANVVMIFEPEDHAAAERAGDAPCVDGIHDVPEVKIACG